MDFGFDRAVKNGDFDLKALVTGGCGYVGSKLVESLASSGCHVTSIDTEWFGNHLSSELIGVNHICADLRGYTDFEELLDGVEVVFHLANIANDPAVELNPSLSWEVNCLSGRALLDACSKSSSVKQFIYASSGSVYGVRPELNVTEAVDLTPISVYNKTKMVAERVALSYRDHFDVYIVRPATVCGLSPRMRLDVSVNALTWSALSTSVVKVFGGDQVRPNIHIEDMIGIYEFIVNESPEPGIYNAGFENLSIKEIAERVSAATDADISIDRSTNDPRSYRLDSSKLLAAGFTPKASVDIAISELCEAYRNQALWYSDQWMTVKTMIELQQKGSLV